MKTNHILLGVLLSLTSVAFTEGEFVGNLEDAPFEIVVDGKVLNPKPLVQRNVDCDVVLDGKSKTLSVARYEAKKRNIKPGSQLPAFAQNEKMAIFLKLSRVGLKIDVYSLDGLSISQETIASVDM